MAYEMIRKCILRYEELYSQGLKTAANRELQDLSRALQSMQPGESDSILNQLVSDLCETDVYAFLFARGNAQIPFALKRIIQDWLYPKCREHKMPELRWFYQIFQYDPNHSASAYEFLQEAYNRSPEDQQTQFLIFESDLSALEYGIHELPSGYLISKAEAAELLNRCEAILPYGNIPSEQAERYLKAREAYGSFIAL